jgi:hypothetical protein
MTKNLTVDNLNKQICNLVCLGKIPQVAGVMLTIVTGMVVVHRVQGAIAYLPSSGPVPLRFELVTAAGASLAWKPLRLALQSAGNPVVPAPVAETMTNGTNVVASQAMSSAATNTISVVSVPAAGPDENENSKMPRDPVIFPVQSDDFSGPVTPQILAGFFKPVPGGTNSAGTAVFMPVGIGFNPAPPKTATESRAIYKTQ